VENSTSMNVAVPRARRHPLLACTILAIESSFGFVFAWVAMQTLQAAGHGVPFGLDELTRDGAYGLVDLLARSSHDAPMLAGAFAISSFAFMLCTPFLTLAYLVRLLGTGVRLVVARSAFLYGRALPLLTLGLLIQAGVAAGFLAIGGFVAEQFAQTQGEPRADALGVAAAAIGLPLLAFCAILRDLSIAFVALGRRGPAAACRSGLNALRTSKLQLIASYTYYAFAGLLGLAGVFWLATRLGTGSAIFGFVLRRAALSFLGTSRLAWLAAALRRAKSADRAARTVAPHDPSLDRDA
jgi:hypothetical protein